MKTSTSTLLKFIEAVGTGIRDSECTFSEIQESGTVFIIGNGGSQAISSHLANDLMKNGRAAHSLSNLAVLTCFANDCGYEHVYAMQLHNAARKGDVLLAISSSGESPNIVEAVMEAITIGMTVYSATGFGKTNSVKQRSHEHLWIPSSNYGVVECAHMTMLHGMINPGNL